MLKVKKLTTGIMQSNCYVIWDDITLDAAIIDPGDDAEYIQSNIGRLNINPKMILATHGHFDHLMAVYELKSNFKIPFALSFEDGFLLKYAQKSSLFYTKTTAFFPKYIDLDLSNLNNIKIGRIKLNIVKTPGHTPGSTTFVISDKKVVFCGDTVFNGDIGNFRHRYSSKADLIKSVELLLDHKIYSDYQFYPGHGDDFVLKDVKKQLKMLIAKL